jgi:hypothetical protein
MIAFKVDTGIPVPEGNYGRYPFPVMNIGDSFSFNKDMLKRLRCAAHAYAQRHNGVRFVFRQISEDEWRCWKVERED